MIENDNSHIDKQQQLAEHSHLKHSCSFDSKHNVLVPAPINQYFSSSEYVVERIRCGGSHTVVFLGRRREDGSGSCLMHEGGEDVMKSGNDGSELISEGKRTTNNNNSNCNSNLNDKDSNSHNTISSHIMKSNGGKEDSLLGNKRSSPTKSKN